MSAARTNTTWHLAPSGRKPREIISGPWAWRRSDSRRSATVKRFQCAGKRVKSAGSRIDARVLSSCRAAPRHKREINIVKFQLRHTILFSCGLLWIASVLSACVNPQQVELLERDQRRARGDLANLQGEIDGFRATLADTRANVQQMQRELSAIKERIDEIR